MYSSFFGLSMSPFGISPDPRFLFVIPQVRESLACLRYGITGRKGFVVMTGEVGTGKTTLLKSVLNVLSKERIASAFVFNPRLDVLDFLEFVLNDFGIEYPARNKTAMLIRLNRWLIEKYRRKVLCVIIIDEAHNLSLELLEEIRLLTNLETSSEKLVQIVLSGQPELAEMLRRPAVRQLRQRVWMWCKTRPLLFTETADYINQRLRIAGCTRPLFTPEAVERIHAFSKGIPRLVNLICEHALINAYAEQISTVPAQIVESVYQDLLLDSEASAGPSPEILVPAGDHHSQLVAPRLVQSVRKSTQGGSEL